MIRVVLVDDQPIVRAGVGRILGHEDGFEVVAECGDGEEAVTAVAAHGPDVVLMDIRMPRLDGIEASRRIARLPDPPPVLVLTTFDEDEVLWGALEAGVSGFLLKDASADDLIAATRAVAGGGAWFDRSVAPRVLDAYRDRVAPANRERQRLEQLTDRENAVLALIARGASNREVGATLFVSEATVKSHVGSIFTKLGVRDRAAAIVFAFDHGVVGIGERHDDGGGSPGHAPPPRD
ncbi:response regulator transcription factor [Ornithinimicrobium cavernae]|uniref:response regulator transcription factor n=1 Tax=Ornithinimicrobium cavernae TaxID=2666047 RepID=UPI000D689AFB|nr:response regulator transcription factor [Ornithinimicrobium cavernae]